MGVTGGRVNGHIPWGLYLVLQIMYLPRYGEMFLAIVALSQISNINFFGGLETNHKCMNIIIAQKCV